MAAIESVNLNRINWCLKDRGIGVEELASAIKMDPAKLEAVLNGETAPSLGQLKSLAKFFNRGLLFFVTPGEVKEEHLRTAGFRTLSNEHPDLDPHIKALMERVERQRQIFLNLREELGEDAPVRFRPPGLPQNDPKAASAVTRKWLSLNSERSFSDYRRTIEARGILVFLSNGYIGQWKVPTDSEIAGFSIYHDQFPIIFVRKENSPQRQLFTLAHELAHLLLNGSGSVDNEDDLYALAGKEKTANAFAGHLLVPDAFLSDIDDSGKPDSANHFEEWLHGPAQRLGVSFEVILRRLMDSGRLSSKEYKAYREWKAQQKQPESSRGSRAYRYREPVHVFGRPFVGTVLEALGARQITTTKASRYLDNIKIKDVHKLEIEFNAL